MNPEIKVLHDTAMEFNDLGKLAGISGEASKQSNYFKIAYLLEKEAALRYYAQKDNTLWRFGLLRSAGWLAVKNGAYEEAQHLALLGLTGKIDSHSKEELETLMETIQQEIKTKDKEKSTTSTPIYGTLSSADADQNLIKVREDGAQKYYEITVPKHLIFDIIKAYFGEVVEIQATRNEQGAFILNKIKKAA